MGIEGSDVGTTNWAVLKVISSIGGDGGDGGGDASVGCLEWRSGW